MKIIKFIEPFFLTLIIMGCSNYSPEKSLEKINDESRNNYNTSTKHSKTKELEDGIYYIYKSCKYRSKDPKPICNEDSIQLWSPLKVGRDYAVRLNSSFNDFYIIKKDTKKRVYFYSNFIENPISGWFEVNLISNDRGFKLIRNHYYQNYGYKNDGSFDELSYYPYENKNYILTSSEEKAYKVNEYESIQFIKHEDEFYINCKEYESENGNISGELFVSCYNQDMLWLKKLE